MGAYSSDPYLADSGFFGQECMARWREHYGASVIAPAQDNTKLAWTAAARRQHVGLRQIVETVHQALLKTFKLENERPHCLAGFYARVAAKVALHNICMRLNHDSGRPLRAFVELVDW
jgi:hypothetical protein